MYQQTSDRTLAQIKQSLSRRGYRVKKASSYSLANDLAAYDLQAPAKNIYPVYTPIRNKLPRREGFGKATNWKEIAGIIGSGLRGMGWVAAGQRSAAMQVITNDRSASFKTLGEEFSTDFESQNAGVGFMDLKADGTLKALQSLMLKEEYGIIGGNATKALGQTPTPAATQSNTAAGAIANGTYDVICVALTAEGYYNFADGDFVVGLIQQEVITGLDGKTFLLKGGTAIPSAAYSITTTGSNNAINASVTPVVGAYAYAWYLGATGAARLTAITTVATVVLTALPSGGNQLASSLTAADFSTNSNVAFDGYLTTAAGNSTAYFNQFANGSKFTASGHGSIVEIDNMLQTMWKKYQVSPEVLYFNAEQLQDLTSGVLAGNSGAPLARYVVNDPNGQSLVAGQFVSSYINPFQAGGALSIPIEIHPNLPPGTVLGWTNQLPIQYQNANVPNVAEVICRMDYYQIDWPLKTRAYESGVYTEEVLALYAPLGIGVLTNITPGIS
jgi:hypothetical protein